MITKRGALFAASPSLSLSLRVEVLLQLSRFWGTS